MPFTDLHVNGEVFKTGTEKANSIADVFGNLHTITLNNSSLMDTTVS